MGSDKAHVKLAGSSLLERVLKVVTPIFDDVMVSRHKRDGEGNDEIEGVRIIEDRLDGRGPVVGICSALQHACHPFVFVIACDMPFISSGLISYLTSLHSEWDIVVPVRDGRAEPMCAVYSRTCLDDLVERLNRGQRGLTSFISETTRSVLYVDAEQLRKHDPALHSFVDIDCAEALAEAEKSVA